MHTTDKFKQITKGVTKYGYIRAPSAVIETALICKLKTSVIHDRVGLGLK